MEEERKEKRIKKQKSGSKIGIQATATQTPSSFLYNPKHKHSIGRNLNTTISKVKAQHAETVSVHSPTNIY